MSGMQNLYGLDASTLADRLAPFDARPYAARQISLWMYRKAASSFAEMTDLSAALRARLTEAFTIERPSIARAHTSIDGTVRYLLALPGGGQVEAVAIPERGRTTFCISSQVGCALGCTFCMTGTLGLTRHLESGEIVGQVAALMADRKLEPNHFNIVYMGMGEPLHNYEALVASLRVLTSSDGFAIGGKRITVSTAGLAPEIERLAKESVRPRLAVSLTATTDALRSELVPINRKYPIARLMDACRAWDAETGERVFLEYVMLEGVNDTPADAARLARLARGRIDRINLIPFNETPLLPYRGTPFSKVLEFRDAIAERGLRVSVRRSRGRDIEGACGMLAFGASAAASSRPPVPSSIAPGVPAPAPGAGPRAVRRPRRGSRAHAPGGPS